MATVRDRREKEGMLKDRYLVILGAMYLDVKTGNIRER